MTEVCNVDPIVCDDNMQNTYSSPEPKKKKPCLLIDSDMSITVQSEDVQLSQHLVERRFHVKSALTNPEGIIVRQLHYTGWPDHGVP